jgi:hypothetical protein
MMKESLLYKMTQFGYKKDVTLDHNRFSHVFTSKYVTLFHQTLFFLATQLTPLARLALLSIAPLKVRHTPSSNTLFFGHSVDSTRTTCASPDCLPPSTQAISWRTRLCLCPRSANLRARDSRATHFASSLLYILTTCGQLTSQTHPHCAGTESAASSRLRKFLKSPRRGLPTQPTACATHPVHGCAVGSACLPPPPPFHW